MVVVIPRGRQKAIGAQCTPKDNDAVVEALKLYGDSVKCWWAGMRPDAFLLVRLESPPLLACRGTTVGRTPIDVAFSTPITPHNCARVRNPHEPVVADSESALTDPKTAIWGRDAMLK